MELRALRYFVAVAEELHFSRAAERVHIAQPPLSQQILKLERELGVRLFTRTRRKVTLTEPGLFLLEAARLILRQTEAAVNGVRAAGQGLVGQLVIGLINSVTLQADIFDLIGAFKKQHPGVVVTLRAMTSVEQIRALHREEVHIGLLRPPVRDKAIALYPISREKLVLALPRNHPFAGAKVVRLKDLATDSFVMLPRQAGFGLLEQTLALFRRAGFSPVVSQEASELQTIIGLVGAGVGDAVLPATAYLLPRKSVVYKTLVPSTTVEIAAAHLKGGLIPPLAAFVDMVRAMPAPKR